jgi:hypothetical protein
LLREICRGRFATADSKHQQGRSREEGLTPITPL